MFKLPRIAQGFCKKRSGKKRSASCHSQGKTARRSRIRRYQRRVGTGTLRFLRYGKHTDIRAIPLHVSSSDLFPELRLTASKAEANIALNISAFPGTLHTESDVELSETPSHLEQGALYICKDKENQVRISDLRTTLVQF